MWAYHEAYTIYWVSGWIVVGHRILKLELLKGILHRNSLYHTFHLSTTVHVMIFPEIARHSCHWVYSLLWSSLCFYYSCLNKVGQITCERRVKVQRLWFPQYSSHQMCSINSLFQRFYFPSSATEVTQWNWRQAVSSVRKTMRQKFFTPPNAV